MIRLVLYLVLAVVLITLVRALAGLIGRAVAGLFEPLAPHQRQPEHRGELKQDPVCGVYVSTETAYRKRVGQQDYYFCSARCRDTFRG